MTEELRKEDEPVKIPETLPVLPLRDIVIFPFMIVVEVPGLSAESLRVVCRGGQVAVSGERRERRPTGAAGFLCLERPHGRFTRTLTLDIALDPSTAEARLQSGLLTIMIPRLKDRRGRETVIPVQREQEP